MKKEEFIKRYGEETYKRKLEKNREWNQRNPDRNKATNMEIGRKGGKYYEKHRICKNIGIQGKRNVVRGGHRRQWRQYKNIIAPDSQCHHNWCPNSAEYTGLALVEADAHRHGFIDVIEILAGEVNLFTEREIAAGGRI